MVELNGHILDQRQLDTLTPVLNDLMHGKIAQADLIQACIQTLEDKGCPLGYTETIADRALRWVATGDTGQSSMTILRHMTNHMSPDNEGDDDFDFGYPLDAGDLNRCLALLDMIPEWRPRMAEMAQYGGGWAALAPIWSELESLFVEEAGLNWSKTTTAPRTRQRLRDALAQHNA